MAGKDAGDDQLQLAALYHKEDTLRQHDNGNSIVCWRSLYVQSGMI